MDNRINTEKQLSMLGRIKRFLWNTIIAVFCHLPISVENKLKFKQWVYQKFGKYINIFKQSAKKYTTTVEYETKDKLKIGSADFIPWKNNNLIDKPIVKFIAFYLPQFHSIPENDKWWGEGFTEWTNVKPARPQFEGHYQPHVPVDLGYYNLLEESTFRRQIEQAKNYGVGGFCFHYYWFNKKRLLEKPIDIYLENPDLDFPFCISWANESWSRRWDGNEKDVLIKQNHSPEDDIDFISYASKYLVDKRYIKIDGKPLLMIYRPDLLPDPVATTIRWRNWCKQNGIGEIYLAYVQSFEKTDPSEYGFDAAVEFPPNYFGAPYVTHSVTPLRPEFKCNILDWKFMAEQSENYQPPEYKLFRGVCPSWDNTARRKNESYVFINSNPERFNKWVYNAVKDSCSNFSNPDERLVFVNAWNEWAEGAHLEPDEKYGYAYLQGIYNVLDELKIYKVSSGKPKMLVVTYNIPKPDRSSGELRFVNELELFSEFWEIDFCILPSHVEWNNTEDNESYIKSLEKKGINVLPLESSSFEKSIRNNKYDTGYFNLYWVGEATLEMFKSKQPNAKTIVDSVDVHFAREETQVKLGQLDASKAKETKRKELAIYKASDITIAVSKDDFQILSEKEKVGDVVIVPNIVTVNGRKKGKRDKSIIFIGSYTWYPNLSAVKWFVKEVWPLVVSKHADAEFLIIGSDPTQEIKILEKYKGVKVVGYVPETKPYYEKTAVSVAPLLVGGGMKGKVNEAMSFGVPVVATSIGAQGFDAVNGKEMMIADNPSEFAECLNNLLQDEDLQQEVGLAGLKLNSSISSPESVRQQVQELFSFCQNGKKEQGVESKNKNNYIDVVNDLMYPLPSKPDGILEFLEVVKLPIVSIIIPVYNQWDYTYACLKSILDNSTDITYEIIIADDNSSDETKEIKKFVKNIKLIRNSENLGFLYNCNNAAKSANGKYIVFLNNDTIVKPLWLKWFVKTMDEKPDVGLIGAKVIFATGKLQEAGSIVFKDGSAMNYGREDEPDLPQYNYFKDVDYGSGCSVCIRTDLWKKAGGFDVRYAPAYYEDTDLSVQVRQMGYRTVYQPKTEIIHFEGVSHGTDLTEGIKKNQVKNQKIFLNKWKEEFNTNNFNRDENLFRARERSMNKKMVLLVDHTTPNVPLTDKTSKVIGLINGLLNLQYVIKLLPDDFKRSGNFITEFEQQGIEILYGKRCQHEWNKWMKENLSEFDLICFADVNLKEKYFSVINELLGDNAKLKLYDQVLIDKV